MSRDFICDGKRALNLTLSRAKNSSRSLPQHEKHLLTSFHPTFVYPIFGQEEMIPGYKGLDIDLRMTSGSLQMYIDITFDKSLPEYDANSLEQTLYQWIPPSYLKNLQDFNTLLQTEEDTFKPVGTKIGSYKPSKHLENGSRWDFSYLPPHLDIPDSPKQEEIKEDEQVVYEAYFATAKTPGWLQLHRRMQFFIPLEIEGGTYIEEEDDRWEFVALYEKRKILGTKDTSYHFVGFTTLYRFYYWPDSTRLRLAQFLITPPHQGTGHGSALYNLVYRYVLSRQDVKELSVEDPSEAFADMRDKRDLKNLLEFKVFQGFDKDWLKDNKKLEEWSKIQREKFKLHRRQFQRILEMALLIPPSSPSSSSKVKGKQKKFAPSKSYRLRVKERIYRHNYEILSTLSPSERKVKLQETYDDVVADYERLLDENEKVIDRGAKRRRLTIDEEEEEED